MRRTVISGAMSARRSILFIQRRNEANISWAGWASGRLLLPGVYDHVSSLERREIELRIVRAPGHIFADRRDRDLTATLDRISALGQ